MFEVKGQGGAIRRSRHSPLVDTVLYSRNGREMLKPSEGAPADPSPTRHRHLPPQFKASKHTTSAVTARRDILPPEVPPL